LDDTELARASARGDQEAFASLFLRHREFVYSVAYRVLLHEEDALDVTQNVFVKLAGSIGSYTGQGSFRGWLATVTTNTALSQLRKPHRKDALLEADELPVSYSTSSDTVTQAEHRERQMLVAQAMEQLSPQQRAIIVLQCCDDIGPAEIAQRMELPAAQVRVQLRRAILRLREIIFTPARIGRGK
jgi:RNA polymerase sigma-70 factor, ECF subfamily